jgi:hypothetical protein
VWLVQRDRSPPRSRAACGRTTQRRAGIGWSVAAGADPSRRAMGLPRPPPSTGWRTPCQDSITTSTATADASLEGSAPVPAQRTCRDRPADRSYTGQGPTTCPPHRRILTTSARPAATKVFMCRPVLGSSCAEASLAIPVKRTVNWDRPAALPGVASQLVTIYRTCLICGRPSRACTCSCATGVGLDRGTNMVG